MPRTPKIRHLTVLFAVLLLVSSCGEDETTSSDLNPLEEALGLENGIEDFFSEEASRRHQESVSTCMKKKGFVFEVFVPERNATQDFGSMESKEFAEESGFGISTLAFSQDLVGPGLKGHDQNRSEVAKNPNLEIVQNLTDEEREAYTEALWGRPPAEGAANSEAEEADSDIPEGCWRESLNKDPLLVVVSELGDELQDQLERMIADPEYKALDKKLSKCISKSGRSVENYLDYRKELLGRVRAIQSDVYRPGTTPEEETDIGEPEATEVAEDALPVEIDEPTSEPELTENQKAELGEIQTEEVEIAVATFDCLEDGLRVEHRELEDRYLQEFVDDNQATIDKHIKK